MSHHLEAVCLGMAVVYLLDEAQQEAEVEDLQPCEFPGDCKLHPSLIHSYISAAISDGVIALAWAGEDDSFSLCSEL